MRPQEPFDVVAVDRGRAVVAEVVTERRRAPKRAEARRPRDSPQPQAKARRVVLPEAASGGEPRHLASASTRGCVPIHPGL